MTDLTTIYIFITFLLSLTINYNLVFGSTVCNLNNEGSDTGVCPDKSTCCPLVHFPNQSGCISFNHHTNLSGVCCYDDSNTGQDYGTGCPGGFHCASHIDDYGERSYFCLQKNSLTDDERSDEEKKWNRQPRYVLYPFSSDQIGSMHGFPVDDTNQNIVGYYSNKYPVFTSEMTHLQNIRVVVFTVHGSGRNADDYLYAGMVSARYQTNYDPNDILVISPRFLSPQDNYTTPTTDFIPMMWNVTGPIPHTWRYGANALPPSNEISSYDCLDAMINFIAKNKKIKFPNLHRIVVIGHSAGGQYVHRWALLSNISAWSIMPIRVLVSNPRSYCYLDGRRFNFDKGYNSPPFEVPNQSKIDSCPEYNQWEWGLDDGGRVIAPYKDRALRELSWNRTELAERYASRDVIYLAGESDTERLKSSCEDDDFEGRFRRERSHYYFLSLRHYFGRTVHKRFVVKNVGHDHALMFESIAAVDAMFGSEIGILFETKNEYIANE
jgi:predicted esterase